MSSEKIRSIERYYENIPYPEDSLSSEIHGKKNQHTINETIKGLVEMKEAAQNEGNEKLANDCESGIYHVSKQVDDCKNLKQEHSADLHTRSNWTDHGWDDNFFVKKQDYTDLEGNTVSGDYDGIIGFDENLNITLTAVDPTLGKPITKRIEDVTADWESIGDWMAKLEELVINAEKTPSGMNVNYEVNNIIKNNWRSMISDSDPTLDPNGISKGYRLQQILHEEFAGKDEGEVGRIIALGGWNKTDFDPTHDTRLFASIKSQIERVKDPKYLTDGEKVEADRLIAKMKKS